MERKTWVTCSIFLLVCGYASVCSAQFNPAFAPPPPGAMDTLSGGSVGPNPAPYMSAAQGVAAPPPAPGGFAAPGAPPPPAVATPAPAQSTYSPYGYGAYGNYGGAQAVPGQPVTPTPTPIPTTTVLAGMRVTDAASGELIDDARYVEVPQSDVEGKYFDDGTHGDANAGDLTFSNVTVRDDVIGAESHQILLRLINALESSDQLTPLEFYRLNILTTETLSEIDQWRVKEAEKDVVLRNWMVQFVQRYKKNPEDLSSPFYDLYVVQPPPRPSINLPVLIGAWKPPTAPGTQLQSAQPAPGTGGGGYSGYGGGGGY